MHISSDCPTLLTSNDTERLGIYRSRSSNGFLEDTWKNDFLFCWSANLKWWWCDGTQLGCDGEDPVKFALFWWFGDFCWYLYTYSVSLLGGPVLLDSPLTHLVFPTDTVTVPSWSPNSSWMSLNWLKARPSSRRFWAKACRINDFSTFEISAPLGMMGCC